MQRTLNHDGVTDEEMNLVISRTVPRHKKMVYLTPRSEKCVYDQTLWGEEPLGYAFEVLKSVCPFTVMDNGDFSKNVLKKCCIFYIFQVKNVEKRAFFEYIFWKITIVHDIEWTNAFGNFESMSKWFLTSKGLVKHTLFASGGKINHFFVSGNGSWNN